MSVLLALASICFVTCLPSPWSSDLLLLVALAPETQAFVYFNKS
jgi:hypothetical protein